jgi:RimJ/RimL family protein N-acetyltransferase
MTGIAVRLLRADDEERLCRLFYRLSPESVYRRFFTLYTHPPAGALRELATVDHDRRDAIVAVVGDEVVGVARYAATSPDTAEVACVVEDAHQGNGLGARLLGGVTALARLHGFTTLEATVLADNVPAIAMLRRVYPDAVWTARGAEYDVRIALATPERKTA